MRAQRGCRQPGEVIDRDGSLHFTWNGARVPAYAGDTIVSALAAAGSGCSPAATSTTGRAGC